MKKNVILILIAAAAVTAMIFSLAGLRRLNSEEAATTSPIDLLIPQGSSLTTETAIEKYLPESYPESETETAEIRAPETVYEELTSPELSAEETGESAEESSQPQSEEYYILNKGTKKFHRPSCGSVGEMKDKNKERFDGSRDEAVALGYSPCGRCRP